jgi:hypothetical protein
MILENIDFTDFYKQVFDIFSNHFSKSELAELMEYVDILSVSNFKCYKANMIVIVARSVGEYRVSSKARINKFISKIRSVNTVEESDIWISDDVVYSIGEMMDRLSIETIKREDFAKNNRPIHMTIASQKLSERVEKYLKIKLNEIDKKGFYECIHEQRTYDLEGIVKELAL